MTRHVNLAVAEQVEWLKANTKGIDKVLANFVELSGCVRGWSGSTETNFITRFECYNHQVASCEDGLNYVCKDIDFECISVTVNYRMQAGLVQDVGVSPIIRVNSKNTEESILVNVNTVLTDLNKWSRQF